jgi:hypothetical protein
VTRTSILALVAGAVLGALITLVVHALLASGCKGPPPDRVPAGAPDRPTSEVHPTRPGAPPPSPAVGTVAAELSASCPTQLAAMSDRLAAAERKLEARLDFIEKYDRGGAAALEHEAKLREEAAKFFAEAPDGYSHDIDCRGGICRIEVIEPERGEFDWNMRFQQEVLHDLTEGYMLTGGTPSHDLVSKDALMSKLIYAEMNGDGTVAGGAILDAVIAHLAASGAIATCAAEDPTEGFLSLRLDLDPGDRAITYAAGGTVASAPVGRCLLAALDRAITATAVPANARSAALYHTIETPPR